MNTGLFLICFVAMCVSIVMNAIRIIVYRIAVHIHMDDYTYERQQQHRKIHRHMIYTVILFILCYKFAT